MSNAHTAVAQSVADRLFAAERAIDSAVLGLSQLPGTITTARTDAKLPFGSSQGPLSDAAEALTLMVRSRHHVARAHDRLRETAVGADMEIEAIGDIFECPPDEPPRGENQTNVVPISNVA